jgi:hypothetical protein
LGAAHRALAELRARGAGSLGAEVATLGGALLALESAEDAARSARARLAAAARPVGARVRPRDLVHAERRALAVDRASELAAHDALEICARLVPGDTSASAAITAVASALTRAPLPTHGEPELRAARTFLACG